MNLKSALFCKAIVFLILLIVLSLASNTVSAKEYFVNASNVSGIEDGSEANPFSTIAKATALAKTGDVVTVHAGVYREEVLIPDDGITFQAYPGEEAVINGTEILTGWAKVNSGEVYKSVMNWDFMPEEGSNQLFVDQKMINLARWPDQTSDDIIKPNDAVAESVTNSGNIVTIKDNEFDEPDGRWNGAQIWINLSHNGADGQGWTGIVQNTSQANHTITLDFGGEVRLGDVPWGLGKNTEYYLFNPTLAAVKATGGVEALLSKGEWWKNADTIYVSMPDGAKPGEITDTQNVVEARERNLAFGSSDPLVNRSFTTIRNFTLFAATITTDNNYNDRRAEIVEDAQGILIEGIKAKYLTHFTNQTGNWQDQWTGRSGIILSGIGNTMRNCTIQYSAGPGVCIMGYGNKLLNCTISDANYSNSNSGAVSCGYLCVDGEIAYNTISNTPMIALHFNGLVNSNPLTKGVARIHHNVVRDFMRRGYDSGAIDQVGHDGQWVRIDHNLIYNTKPDAIAGPSKFGIYLDFGGGASPYWDGKYIVDHNVVYNVYTPILINHINDAWIYNNTGVLVGDPRIAIVNGNGGTGKTDIIRNNIFGGTFNTDSWGSLINAVRENNIFDAKGTVLTDLFVDPANHNFQLKPTAVSAINKGLDVTPFNDPLVGLPDLGAFEYGKPSWSAGPGNSVGPVIFPNGGSFIGSTEVEIKNSGLTGTIRYTLDGSDPTFSSPEYVEKLIINETQVLKARTFISETEFSEVAAANFSIEKVNLPLLDPETPNDLLPGVNYEYYDWWGGLSLEKLPDLQTWTPLRNGVSGTIDLSPAHEEDNFAFRFSGYLYVPTDGIYTFYTTSDDNSKLYIGNTLVVNNDYMQAPTERTGRIGLKAGYHAITVEFMEVGGGQIVTASYKGPGISKRFLPAGSLWHQQYLAQTAKVSVTPLEGKFTDGVEVNMTCATPGAQIYYTTDGSTPTKASVLFVQKFTITNNTPIKAIAFSDALPASAIAYINYVPSTSRVSILPNGGSFFDFATVTLNTITPGATILYTLDGTDPTINSTLYTGPVKIEASARLRTIAVKDGFAESYVDSASFTIQVSYPTFLPVSNSFTNTVMVSISCTTPGASIYYAINGTPTTSSTLYTAPFEINATCFIKAMAVKVGLTTSPAIKKSFILTTGIGDNRNSELIVFPNPSEDGRFSIQLPVSLTYSKILLRISDLIGQVVSEEWIKDSNDGMIRTSKQLKSGCYILDVIFGNRTETKKLMVK
jgi:PA14 domain/Chitobiase/beta-hexosaminidase C-terminal domain/Secretion system C-terminal sorting domain